MVNFTEACREKWNKRMAICPLLTKRRMFLKNLKFTFSYLWPNVPSLSHKFFCLPQEWSCLQMNLHQLCVHAELFHLTAFPKTSEIYILSECKNISHPKQLRFQTVPATSTSVWLLKTIIWKSQWNFSYLQKL